MNGYPFLEVLSFLLSFSHAEGGAGRGPSKEETLNVLPCLEVCVWGGGGGAEGQNDSDPRFYPFCSPHPCN